jgi:preprotein translocase subunit SecD
MTFRTVLREEVAEIPTPTAWLTRSYPAPPGDEINAAEGDEAAGDEAAAEGDEATGDEATADDDAATGDEATGDEAAADDDAAVGDDATLDLTGEGEDTTINLDAEGNVVDDSPDAASEAPPSIAPMDDFDTRLEAGTNEALITSDIEERFGNIDCSTVGSDVSGEPSDPDTVLVTCSDNMGTAESPYYQKYILGPVMVEGDQLSNANSGLQTNAQGQTTNEWVVNIQLTTAGARQFSAVSSTLLNLPEPRNQFAIVLDDRVVSAPRINSAIPDGRAEISGSFTAASAKTLADQLSFGSLPLNFTVMSQEQISATLGSEQLRNGIIAGLIGLILVALYSLLQYRALAFVTITSLIMATGITYGSLLLLSWVQGYRLSLAGVAGIIVSIGVTADSFIVYFERIKDELRDGRTLAQSVDLAWLRARRTIIASDAVNFIAAIVLYFVSVGSVRGFAFTLGLTTAMDLAVVVMFTHPMIQLLSRLGFWANGHPWSGLDPHRLGAPGSVHYAGRGRVVRVSDGTRPEPRPVGARVRGGEDAQADGQGSSAPPVPRTPVTRGAPGQSIAQRKAAAKAAVADSTVEEEL